MKNLLLIFCAIILFSCKKNADAQTQKLNDTIQKIDSINAARAKYNDSIKILNDKNRFGDLSGNHKLTYKDADGYSSFGGNITFTKTGRDLYEVKGDAKSGNNFLKIDGNIKRVSEKHLNFEGKISQKIQGSSYVRNQKTTFLDEKKGKFWRLQHKVNNAGFVDYIDIFK